MRLKNKKIQFFILIFACFFQAENAFSQNEKPTFFTVNNGLPSNNVYQILEGRKGFLWIATDAGIARFDGKNFQIYTTQQGLPDNDIFYLDKEKDGRIWASGFKQKPVYFDETKNRFVCPVDKKTLDWFNNFNAIGTNFRSRILGNGSVFFGNKKHFLIFKNAKLIKSGNIDRKWEKGNIEEFPDNSSLLFGFQNNSAFLYYYRGERPADSTKIWNGNPGFLYSGGIGINNGRIYLRSPQKKGDGCVIFSNIRANPIRYKKDTIRIPSKAMSILFSDKSFYFTTTSGKVFVYDKETLKLKHAFGNGFLINGYGEDSKGNYYISTVDKGFLMFKKQNIGQLEIPKNFSHTNFISISEKNDGTIFAGNYYGEVVEFSKNRMKIHETNNVVASKIKKILFSQNSIYTFSEQGIYRNYREKIILPKRAKNGYPVSFAKTAATYNDSIILLGTHYGLLALNTKTQKMRELIPGDLKNVVRATAIAKAAEPFAYFGSTIGLYRYDFNKNKYISLAKIYPQLGDIISAICYAKDGILWTSTASNRILALKNDKIISDFSLGNEENTSTIRNIAAGKPGEIWVSTSNGIKIINYHLSGKTLNYNIRNLTINDGLLSNNVQEMLYQNGKIYATTNQGISVIPENYEIPKTEIPVYLTEIFVNQKEIEIAQNYHLKYGQQDLQMQFSGVDLNGYFSHFQYALDNAKWINFRSQTLSIQLNTGKHQLKIRAIDINGNISNKVLILDFDVEVPFWQRVWFWIVLGAVAQIILYIIISRHLKRRKESEFARKAAELQTATLEQQAFTSLMNPHFIFNALNSIQHYINVQDRKNANRYLSDFASLIRKNFDAAQCSFIPLEEEIENIKIYLEMEKMRFGNRFTYSIEIAEDLEAEDWMIPTILIQPLLENVLIHGIIPSVSDCHISVDFSETEENLIIEITDNGIGVINSENLKNKESDHKSSGILLIKKRISALGKFSKKPMTFEMKPAFENLSNPGNQTRISVPQDLYQNWRKEK